MHNKFEKKELLNLFLTRKKSLGTRLFFWFCFILLLQSQISLSSSTTGSKYYWEDFDYYEILGLTKFNALEKNETKSKQKPKTVITPRKRRKERSEIKHADIRKAYRKQAQRYHPDKYIQRKKRNSTNTETESSTKIKERGTEVNSIEEANALFSRIAEAYDTLSDANRREEYDLYLSEEEEARSSKEQEIKNDSGAKSFFSDPKAVFEEFFFGTKAGKDETEGFENSWWDDLNDQYYTDMRSDKRNIHKSQNRFEREQPHVFERTERIWDPDLRKEILIVYRREEWDHSGRYIIVAQNFVVDNRYIPSYYNTRYGGRTNSNNYNDETYIPISDVYVVEEGYMNLQDWSHGHNEEDQTTSNHYSDREKGDSILYPGMFLSPGDVMNSENGRFFLLLTNDCEILILRRDYENNVDTIIWSSNTFLGGLSSQCFLSLYGSQLVLFAGMDSRSITSVIWSSPNSSIVPGGKGYYFACLDDDGALVIYRTRELEKTTHHVFGDEFVRTKGPIQWFEDFLENSSRAHRYHREKRSTTRASQAWDHVRDWTLSRIRNHKNSKSKSHKCVWATGPFGCFNSGRKVIIVGSSIKRSVKQAFAKVDNALDKFLESLGDDEDIDVIDTFGRVMGKVGDKLGNSGMKMAKRGLLEGKIMTRVVRDTVRERFRRWINE